LSLSIAALCNFYDSPAAGIVAKRLADAYHPKLAR
jgi:hypothetical protein